MAFHSPLARAGQVWRSFEASLLFMPSLMTTGAILLFLVTAALDNAFGTALEDWAADLGGPVVGALLFAGSANAASQLLASIAGAWATIAGVIFSVTLVTLQLSATKYSAEVIPTFERDRLNQVVLGSFAGTFVYALLVLKTVRLADENGDGGFVPFLGVNLAVILAITSLFLFIAFLGNLAAYMRPTRFVDDLARRASEARGVLLPPFGDEGFEECRHAPKETSRDDNVRSARIVSTGEGYVQAVDWRMLQRAFAKYAKRSGSVPTRVRMRAGIGDRVGKGDVLLELEGAEIGVDERLASRVEAAFKLEKAPDSEQNPIRATRTLGDIGVTALSGGATDVGVAKSALTALLRLAEGDVDAPRPPERFHFHIADHCVEVRRGPESIHENAYLESKRILDKAASQAYWDVFEAGVDQARKLLPRAASSGDARSWNATLAWLDPTFRAILDLEDEAARKRMVRKLGESAAAVRRAGGRERAQTLLDLMGRALVGAREEGALRQVMEDAVEDGAS